jgi:hypothetical protein
MTSDRSDRRSAPRADDPELRGRRSQPRAYLVLPGSAEALSGHLHVVLLDVSCSGARLEGNRLPGVGREIILRCGGIDSFGTIAWTASGRCGVQFDEPISVQDLRTLQTLYAAVQSSPLTPAERQAADDWMTGLAR